MHREYGNKPWLKVGDRVLVTLGESQVEGHVSYICYHRTYVGVILTDPLEARSDAIEDRTVRTINGFGIDFDDITTVLKKL